MVPEKEQQLCEGRFIRRYRSCPNDRVYAPRYRWRLALSGNNGVPTTEATACPTPYLRLVQRTPTVGQHPQLERHRHRLLETPTREPRLLSSSTTATAASPSSLARMPAACASTGRRRTSVSHYPRREEARITTVGSKRTCRVRPFSFDLIRSNARSAACLPIW